MDCIDSPDLIQMDYMYAKPDPYVDYINRLNIDGLHVRHQCSISGIVSEAWQQEWNCISIEYESFDVKIINK